MDDVRGLRPEAMQPTKAVFRSVPKAYVKKYGANRATILTCIAWILKNRQGKTGFDIYERAGRHYLAYPVGRKNTGGTVDGQWTYLSVYFPWLCDDTFTANVIELSKTPNEKAPILHRLPNPDKPYRYDAKLDKKVRNPYWYGLTEETIEEITATTGEELLHFSSADAQEEFIDAKDKVLRLGINGAIVWNKVSWLFEKSRVDQPETEYVSLEPVELGRLTGLPSGTIRHILAKLVTIGRLARTEGTPKYKLMVANPLADKFTPIAAKQSLAVAQIDADLRYAWKELAGTPVDKKDDRYFAEAASLCHKRGFNPVQFVQANLDEREKSRHPRCLTTQDAVGKYLHRSNRDVGYSCYLINRAIDKQIDIDEKQPPLENGSVLLDESNELSAWYRCISAFPTDPETPELLKKYAEQGRYELLKNFDMGIEAVASTATRNFYPENLFPHHCMPTAKPKTREEQVRDAERVMEKREEIIKHLPPYVHLGSQAVATPPSPDIFETKVREHFLNWCASQSNKSKEAAMSA